jgi:hypothetical protein
MDPNRSIRGSRARINVATNYALGFLSRMFLYQHCGSKILLLSFYALTPFAVHGSCGRGLITGSGIGQVFKTS